MKILTPLLQLQSTNRCMMKKLGRDALQSMFERDADYERTIPQLHDRWSAKPFEHDTTLKYDGITFDDLTQNVTRLTV